MQKVVGLKLFPVPALGDGGNLGEFFNLTHSSGLQNLSHSISSSTALDELFKGRILYHLHFWNYLKFIPKWRSQIVEKIVAGGKNGREILDHIYS